MSLVPAVLRVLRGETLKRPPVWFMRQAGRSLPEYRAVRQSVADFLALCMDTDKAAEVTLQPVRRFAFDAAIVFADILLIPWAMGQNLWFVEGEGPKLGPMPELAELRDRSETCTARLSFVGETLAKVRSQLESERALIGFAGGPWTVATYMLEGRGGQQEQARTRVYADAPFVESLVDILADATADYLVMQARAGAQVLQIFESWAEHLPEDVFERLVIGPHNRVVDRVRAQGVTAPVIGFPRGAGSLVETYVERVGVQGVGLDVQASAAMGRRLQSRVAIQGALDPLLLRAGGEALERRVDALIEQWGAGPYIFNLGHGVLPDTPLDHIERVVGRVRGV